MKTTVTTTTRTTSSLGGGGILHGRITPVTVTQTKTLTSTHDNGLVAQKTQQMVDIIDLLRCPSKIDAQPQSSGIDNGLTALEAQQMLEIINSLRSRNGLSPLTNDTKPSIIAPPTPTTTPSHTPGCAHDNGLTAQETQQMLDCINAQRSSNGLPPLSIDPRLMKAAAGHSRDQAARCTMGHAGGDGKNFSSRITAQGYKWGQAAENVAAGQHDVAGVMTGWLKSAPHRANLLNPGVTHVGFAKCVGGGNKPYWTQVFARPL